MTIIASLLPGYTHTHKHTPHTHRHHKQSENLWPRAKAAQMRKAERGREGTVSQQDMRFINAARTIMKNMLNYFTETLTGEGRGRGADRGRVKVERGFIKFKINCSNVVFSCFARVANVLHVCQLWGVARRECGKAREGGGGGGVTRSGYATCAPLLRH